ncbi:hypothetical protein [Mycobacterium sp. 236(2023)]|uniref:hypothetical protein n=1 Tax=Mycobacterium sp. 236(2023) TaxID=3038163 RepID=UPI002415493B|nr:hypothetical protein [Mycobacterium sp. 236(2023)]MDG4667998.1 hypothetical protein [Mycobacterium sp. 236(2023)]
MRWNAAKVGNFEAGRAMTEPNRCGRHADLDRETKYAETQALRTIIAALILDMDKQQEIERELAGCEGCCYNWMRSITGLAIGLLEARFGGKQGAIAWAEGQLDAISNAPDLFGPQDD